MHTIKQIHSLPGDERGATLLVALILLVLISLIGVSTLKSAAVVEKMASSDYRKNITFQASESGVARTLQDKQNISDIIRSETNFTFNDVDTNIANTVADVQYTYAGYGDIDGATIGAIGGQRIMITSTGRLVGDSGVANTKTTHGMVQIVPGVL